MERKYRGCKIEALFDQPRGWRAAKWSELECGQSIVVESKDGCVHTHTCYRAPKPKNMSPLQYYKKYKVVPDRYEYVHNGRYYCNPAHCSQSWKNKKERDKHLNGAYSLLD